MYQRFTYLLPIRRIDIDVFEVVCGNLDLTAVGPKHRRLLSLNLVLNYKIRWDSFYVILFNIIMAFLAG